MKFDGKLFGTIPIAQLSNQLHNLGLLAGGFFVTRGYLSGDQLGQLVGALGVVATLWANGHHVSAIANFDTSVSKD
jgi:hypothetical protein